MIPTNCYNCTYYQPSRISISVDCGKNFCSTPIKSGVHSTCPLDKKNGMRNCVGMIKRGEKDEFFYLKKRSHTNTQTGASDSEQL